jgi:hypothetical protein
MPRLEIVEQPPDPFYNDPPHRKKFPITVKLTGGKSAKSELRVTLLYENGNGIVCQPNEKILVMAPNNQTSIASGVNIQLQFGIMHVSFRHQRQKFKLRFECEGCSIESTPILVKAKPPAPKRKFVADVKAKVQQFKRTCSQDIANSAGGAPQTEQVRLPKPITQPPS